MPEAQKSVLEPLVILAVTDRYEVGSIEVSRCTGKGQIKETY